MSRSKKIFIALSIFFILLLVAVSVDISKRTTFPGSRPQLKQRIQDTFIEKPENAGDSSTKIKDSTAIDSI